MPRAASASGEPPQAEDARRHPLWLEVRDIRNDLLPEL
jgi:hypothetical protein